MKKVIVITGGSSGMGKATAKRVVKDHTVIILADNQENLESAAKEIGCEFEQCNVRDSSQVQAVIEKIAKKHGRVDVLLNSAGVWIEGKLEDHTHEDMERIIEVNTMGTMYATKAVVPLMKEQKGGLIINIISQAGIYANAERSVYTASKFALTGFTKSLQPELSKFGIRVTGIYPGKVETPLFDTAGNHKNMGDALHVEEVAKLLEFVITSDDKTQFPEIGIKNVENWT